jgi:NitT/TauT family transport system substrate-binding protein
VSEPQIVSRFRSTFSLVIVVVSLVCLGASLSSAVAQEKTKVRAAYVPVATWLPLWVAQDMGAFEKNGLDVSLTSFPILALLPPTVGKQFDLAPTTAPDLLNAAASGLKLVAVAGGTVELSSNQSYQVMVRPDSGINSPKDLNGKRIGTSAIASVMHVANLHWLKANGADPASIVPVEVPFTGMMDQLKAGRVDAVEALQPFVGQMLAAGYKSLGDPLLSVGDPVLFPFWMAETNWAKANRAVIKKWIVSLEQGLAMIESDDKMAREVLAKYAGLPAPIVARIPYPAYQFSINPGQLAVWKDVLVSQGKPVKNVDVETLVVTAD